MKFHTITLLSALAVSAPLVSAHPDHDQDSPFARRGIRSAPPPAIDKPYGRPGDSSQIARTINLDVNDKMRFSPSEVGVKQGETIKFVVRNSGKVSQFMVLGSSSELKERAAMLKQFPKMEMNQPNQVLAKPGESAELLWQFTQAGAFSFGCAAPACVEDGAIGKITVNAN